jgi:hypothetical protein
MTAKVAISVASMDHAVQVPVQSVLEREDRFFCLVAGIEGEIEAREVTLGPANDSSVVIRKGLQADEHIFLAPQNYERDTVFPPAEQPVSQVAVVEEKA